MSNDATRRAEFLAYFDKHFQGDRQAFMEKTGLSKGRVTQYTDEGEPFGEKAAASLEKRLGVSHGTVFPSLAKAAEPKSTTRSEGVPVVGTAQLGDNGNFYALDFPVGHGDGFLEWPSKDPNAYGLRCKGESMKPRIRHGEYVVIEPNHPVNPGDEVLVRSIDGRVMVKQLAFIRDGLIHLDSVNETFPRISLAAEEVAVMHYVAAIAKGALWFEDTAQHEAAAPKAKPYKGKDLAGFNPAALDQSKVKKEA
jgi:phage repressor protein C with HTH and peptisase S24 domain